MALYLLLHLGKDLAIGVLWRRRKKRAISAVAAVYRRLRKASASNGEEQLEHVGIDVKQLGRL
jgi:hypothetical protein